MRRCFVLFCFLGKVELIEKDSYKGGRRQLWALETSWELQEHEEPPLGRKRWVQANIGERDWVPPPPSLSQTCETPLAFPRSPPHPSTPVSGVLQIFPAISPPTPWNLLYCCRNWKKGQLLPRSFTLQIPNGTITGKAWSEELEPKQTLKPETLLFDSYSCLNHRTKCIEALLFFTKLPPHIPGHEQPQASASADCSSWTAFSACLHVAVWLAHHL